MSVFSVVPFIYPLFSTHTNLTRFSLQVTASQKVIMPLYLRHLDSPAPRLLRVTKWYERQNLKGATNCLVITYVTGSWYIIFYHGACNYEVFCLLGTHVGPLVLHPLCMLFKTVSSFVIYDIIYICEVSKLARGSKSWLASQKLFSVPEPCRCWCSDKLLLLRPTDFNNLVAPFVSFIRQSIVNQDCTRHTGSRTGSLELWELTEFPSPFYITISQPPDSPLFL